MTVKIPDIARFVHEMADKLDRAYIEPGLSLQYAWWMVEAITKKSHASLLVAKTLDLTASQAEQLEKWVEKQVYEREPLQYLIGTVPFLNTEILVSPPTLIPRIETEQWVGDLLEQIKFLRQEKLTILDLCSGSGCIAIALGKNLPHATVYAVDLAEHAIELTKKNIEHNKIKNVIVVQSDLFARIPSDIKFDLIVSNPPYVTEDEWDELEPSVTRWEDKTALVAQQQGLEIIEKIIEVAPQFLNESSIITEYHLPQLLIEIGYKQGKKVADVMKATGFNNVQIVQDLAQKDRVVMGSFAHVATNRT